MYSQTLFQRTAKAIKESGTYSPLSHAWTIGVPNVQMIVEELLRQELDVAPVSCVRVLEEGRRRGFWEVNDDHEYTADLVVIRPLLVERPRNGAHFVNGCPGQASGRA